MWVLPLQPCHSAIESFHIVWLLTGTLSLKWLLGDKEWSAGLAGNVDATRKALTLVISVIHTLFFFFLFLDFKPQNQPQQHFLCWFVDCFSCVMYDECSFRFEFGQHVHSLKWNIETKRLKTFFQDLDWVNLFKRRLGCFISLIYVAMDL